jgi:soluble P-type ATPase
MRTVWSALACMSLAVVTAGCAIQQTVEPVQGIQGREIRVYSASQQVGEAR